MGKPESKQRLDVVVVNQGLSETRARAQSVIMGGGVMVDGVPVTRPSHLISPSAEVRLTAEPSPFVSRGGLKLQHALDSFALTTRDAIALDVGASTGGFTDVLLRAGARRVYAVDVGYGQLAWTLRNDPRVVVLERTNIRFLRELAEPVDVAVIDTSFISLRQVLPPVKALLKSNGHVVALVKPQFEAGRDKVRKGVVRDPAIWRSVLEEVTGFAGATGWHVQGLVRSPLRGPAGNVEFLLHLACDSHAEPANLGVAIDGVVDF